VKNIVLKYIVGLMLMSSFSLSGTNLLEVQNFVKRFYTIVLEREADVAGLNNWTNTLVSGENTGADIAIGFIFSEELKNKNLDDNHYITLLYQTFFNREADSSGFSHWKEILASNGTREEVLNGFLYSEEFIVLAHSYGIKATIDDNYAAATAEVESFVSRFYTEVLGREAESEGLNYWSSRLAARSSTGADVASGFIFSPEFTQKGLNDNDFVKTLYRAFFNREADSDGLAYWITKLTKGVSKADILDGFLRSAEFEALAGSYGILANGDREEPAVREPQLLYGSIIKGPIDSATVLMRDASGNSISIVSSDKGTFGLFVKRLSSAYYLFESFGGSYEDEATKSRVNIDAQTGLKTLLTRDEVQVLIDTNTTLTMTPETTIFASLVTGFMVNGKSLKESRMEAESLINRALIEDTSPVSMSEGDTFLNRGNLASSIPKDQTEAFARNRAISLSYMIRDLGLAPSQVFEVIRNIAYNLLDGTLDDMDLNDDGEVENIKDEFALARLKLFQNTMSRLQNGELTEDEKSGLQQLGIDVNKTNGNLISEQQRLDVEVTGYLSSETLPTLHTLTTIADEDSNLSDTQASYTLTANKDVNVTIETPNGSWITPMWRYNNAQLPLVIRTHRGNAMTLHFNNQLDANSTIHWHGFKIPADMDGGPDTPVVATGSKDYTFTMNQPAAPLWFHPHPDMQTGKQVYMGLAGVYLLEDDITKSLETNNKLPSGTKDTVLLVQDRRFEGNVTDAVRKLKYMDMQMDMDGMLGDTILVNGSVVPKQDVSNTLHRFRLYNVSNARTYQFALSDSSTFTVIGTDGGLLDKPTEVTSITLGAAERVEIVIDFSRYNLRDKVMLISKPFSAGMMGNMNNDSNMNTVGNGKNRSRMGENVGSEMPNMGAMQRMKVNGAGLSIMRFDISKDEAETVSLYDELPSNAEIKTRYTGASITNSTERKFVMTMAGMGSMQNTNGMSQGGGMQQMSFVINGKAFDSTRVDEFIEAGATELWSIRNMSPMAHPFHAHAIQYQILSRNGIPASGIDLGWKDTFLVQPGETVKVIGKFETVNVGDYMYHCHILEHEDAGMMGYFRVGDTGVLGEQ
jgi:blue copper oxidase